MEEWIKKLPKIKGTSKKTLQRIYERYNKKEVKNEKKQKETWTKTAKEIKCKYTGIRLTEADNKKH